MSDVESKLKTILLEKYEISIETLEEHKNKQDFLFEIGFDSLDKLELQIDIETKFGIGHIDEEKYSSYSFSEMVKAIETHNKAKEHTNKPTIKHPGFCITVKNQPFCKLMERPCYMPKRENNTDKPYCDFIKCKLYENFNKLR